MPFSKYLPSQNKEDSSTPIGWEGGGMQGATKWWANVTSLPNDFHWCYFHLHMSHKAAKSNESHDTQLLVLLSAIENL